MDYKKFNNNFNFRDFLNDDFFFSTLDTKDSVKIEGNEVLLLNLDAYIIHDNGPHNDNTIKLTQILNENS